MDKIKILTVGNHPTVKGGITSVIQQILAYDWQSRGIEMSFIPTYMECGNIKKILYFAFAYIRVLLFLIIRRPDAVHIHMSYRGSFYRKHAIYKLCKRFHIKVIMHLHGSEFEKWYCTCADEKRQKIRTLLKGCDAFIVLGEQWEKAVLDIEPATKTVVVNNTVRLSKEMCSWNEEEKKILFLGVLIERKGVADLIEAIRLLKEEKQIQNMKFLIAGSGKEEANLKQLAKKYKLEENIEFLGWINSQQKQELLKNSQLLVLPSYNEGLPIAVLEAISYGLPVVATDVGDMTAAVFHEENGCLFKPGDVAALKESITYVLSDKERYETMSECSRKIARTRFSEADFFGKIEESYRN